MSAPPRVPWIEIHDWTNRGNATESAPPRVPWIEITILPTDFLASEVGTPTGAVD